MTARPPASPVSPTGTSSGTAGRGWARRLWGCMLRHRRGMQLSLAGAVVVQEGGLLSHAAVIARELGLVAVVGAAGAMAAVPDGALVEVDPGAGRVRVLAPAVP